MKAIRRRRASMETYELGVRVEITEAAEDAETN
jgi:hypothetical protein